MASALGVMEKPINNPIQHQQQKSHEALKCPRCDSSNTKFCYYNNYSLSQPRHFCKACKRYWTRGGTLRNVPVGGGCRKNKRVKRPLTTAVHVVAPAPSQVNPQRNHNTNTNLDHHPITTSNNNTNHHHHLNPLFYGLLPSNPNYPRFDHPRVSSVNETPVSGYDLLQPHVNASGLVFSSSGAGGSLMANHGHNQSLSFSTYMNNSSMYGGGGGGSTASCSTSAPTMASLLASSLNQQQTFMEFASYDGGSMAKDMKMEATQNMMKWNSNNFHDQNKNDQIEGVVSSDPNSIIWDNEGGGWLDSTNNIGSSVPSLI